MCQSKDALVSVIVPAYNVEKYLAKCIFSILDQSYENIEIIIVDDGSPDMSGKIADDFAQLDKRVKVIHKNNEGVSIARNYGIITSTGDYIVFVDGDDYLSRDFVEYMISIVQSTGAEFCLSTDCYMTINDKNIGADSIRVLSPEEATALLLSPRVVVGCWNKIFRRDFIIDKNILFSSSLFYGEGLNFIVDASQLATKVGVGNRRVYYYRKDNANSATSQINMQKIKNGEAAIENIRKNLNINDYKVIEMLDLHACLFSMNALISVLEQNQYAKYRDECKCWKANINRYILKLLLSANISVYTKAKLVCVWISPWCMMKLSVAKRRYTFKHSI